MAYISDLRFINGHWVDTSTPDYLFGTRSADTINVYGGDNAVSALGGNDVIFDAYSYSGGYSGADKIYAGDGDDLIVTSLDGAGNEYDGGADIDTLNCIPNTHGVAVNLTTHLAQDRSTSATSQVWNIENVTGSSYGDVLTGDGTANTLRGYDGSDWLFGEGGRDTLYGGRGFDVVFGGSGNDTLYGEDAGDWLHGDAGADTIQGGAGSDFLDGGLGRDDLSGAEGADTYQYFALADSGTTTATADVIADFVHLQDRIDVSGIDARTTTPGDQSFRFIGTSVFSAAGQVRYVVDLANLDTIVVFNTDNDAAAEMVIRIGTVTGLTAQDFVL